MPTRHFIFVLARREAGAGHFQGARLGTVVSKKVGNAVVRNRVKRLVREAFRATRAQFGDFVDVVVIARSTEAGWRLSDVVSEWVAASDRIMRLSARLALAQEAQRTQTAPA